MATKIVQVVQNSEDVLDAIIKVCFGFHMLLVKSMNKKHTAYHHELIIVFHQML